MAMRHRETRKNDSRRERNERIDMADFCFLLVTALFFAAAIGYTYGCDRL
jgi:hypothetical protein